VSYDLKKIKAPHVTGLAMRAFTVALENSVVRSLLLPGLLRDAGFDGFRARRLDDEPSVHPPLPRNQSVTQVQGPAVNPCGAQGPIPDGSFRFLTCHDFTSAFSEGRSDPEEVAKRVIAAIAKGDAQSPPMRTMIASFEDDILTQARASNERYRQGKPLGPLDGVPVAVKDETDQAPYPTTVGTSFKNEPATHDSAVVERIRAQGAVLIGKANMHEVGLGVTGLNTHHGTARNPYHPDHHTGGSSSGSAAAVASGLCPLAIGADGGGSIRIPSAFCGVVGLKATFGRISEFGTAPLCWSLAHMGPIGATARDCAIGYQALAGPDPRYEAGLGQPEPHLAGFDNLDLSDIRIGVFSSWFDDAEAEVVESCRAMLKALTSMGATLVEVQIPELELARLAHTISITSEMVTSLESDYEQDRSRFGLDIRTNMVISRTFTGRDYVRAQQARTRVAGIFASVLEQVDVIATPTTGITAPAIHPGALSHGESNLTVLGAIMRYAFPANLIGLPGISFPAGYDAGGLPIGIQFMGRPWCEHTLLRLAHAGEQHTVRVEPKVHFPLLAP
jgi:Asp-tRNA(Asn)/Glu-tRNA(Gln) amidotransferase A subunit family amidase